MDVVLAIFVQFGLYGLLTMGVAVIFAATRVVNLAQGDLLMVGAYVAVTLDSAAFGWRVLLAPAIGLPLLLVLERLLLRGRLTDGAATMLVTWGAGLALRQIAELSYGATPRSVPAPVNGVVDVLGTPYPAYRLIAAGVALAVIGGVLLAAYRTGWGLALRAVADNPGMAALLGTNPQRMRTTAFAIGGSLAVLAGALYAPTLAVTPSMGFTVLVPVFFGLLFSRPGALGTAAGAAFAVAALAVLLRTWLSDIVAEAVFYIVVIGVAAVRAHPRIRRFVSWCSVTLARA